MSDIQKQIQEALSENPNDLPFQEMLDAESSPLNEPVVERVHTSPNANYQATNENEQVTNEAEIEETTYQETHHEAPEEQLEEDASEQEINENYTEATVVGDSEEFELPPGHAKQAADTVLGMANNLLEIGGGFFVKIRKHKEFYDFDQVIHRIDEKNEKNIERIKLDKEDKVLLRPLLITVLKTKAKNLTPEQQLIGAIISILMKKARFVMEIKAENEVLVERILDIVREEKGYSDQDEVEDEDEANIEQATEYQTEVTPEPTEESVVEEVIIEDVPETIAAQQIVEVAEELPKENKENTANKENN